MILGHFNPITPSHLYAIIALYILSIIVVLFHQCFGGLIIHLPLSWFIMSSFISVFVLEMTFFCLKQALRTPCNHSLSFLTSKGLYSYF